MTEAPRGSANVSVSESPIRTTTLTSWTGSVPIPITLTLWTADTAISSTTSQMSPATTADGEISTSATPSTTTFATRSVEIPPSSHQLMRASPTKSSSAPSSTSSPDIGSTTARSNGQVGTSTSVTVLSNATELSNTRRYVLSPKAVVGIGVGSAVIGAVMAACLFLFILHKKRKASIVQRKRLDTYQDHSDSFSGTTAVAIVEKADLSTTLNKDADLLSPASDFELQEDFNRLNASIRTYAETYCTAAPELSSLAQDHSVHANNLDGLPELLSPDCPLSEIAVDSLLKNPTTRLPAIRFLIAWNILTNISPSAPLSSTLLPPEISRCLEALEPIPLGPISVRPTSPFRCPSPSSMRIIPSTTSSSDWLMSLHKWRQVTGAAMAAIYSDGVEQQLDFRDSRNANVSELTASLVRVLQLFVVKGKGGDEGEGVGEGCDEGGAGDENGVRLRREIVVAKGEEAEAGEVDL
ncbi:hypothetical protein DOTSEDRAFT_55692 [Dothistroma septosporum NZE10]|uniref:Uncharacterized protein n=1 Tax=Dothistroma septosporum (strain NZE10 / CBS 128990) TaxID=675120 RepID=N1PD20_DOTSN|nr:hypothetical protein DOTSEDRAFT_55692 [Dothistroma septosporum NZE10]